MEQDINDKQSNEVSILIVSCDRYKDLWPPFFKCFFKYWPDCPYPVLLASNYSKFENEKVTNISFGEDSDYSTNMINILKHVNTPWFILWFEDAFISAKINTNQIQQLVEEAQNNHVGYLKLTVDTPLIFTKDKSAVMGPIPKGVKYRGAVGMALYQTQVFQKLLVPGESAWQLDKSPRSNSFSEPFYALTSKMKSNPPIEIINSVIKGKWAYNAPQFLKKENLEIYLPNREIQPLKDWIYINLFLLRLELYRIFKKYWYE